MHRVVLDTNIYLSAFLFAGNARRVLDLVIENRIKAYISDPILGEIRRVLGTEKFLLRNDQIESLIHEIEYATVMVYPEKQVVDICRDNDDHIILECSIQSKADFIITGDKDLLVLDNFLGTNIIPPADYLDKLHS